MKLTRRDFVKIIETAAVGATGNVADDYYQRYKEVIK